MQDKNPIFYYYQNFPPQKQKLMTGSISQNQLTPLGRNSTDSSSFRLIPQQNLGLSIKELEVNNNHNRKLT